MARDAAVGGLPDWMTLWVPDCPAEQAQATTPERATALVLPYFEGLDREAAVLVSLTINLQPIAVDLLSVGTVDQTFMHPREAFRQALVRGAAKVLLFHFHPSGNPEPSPQDWQVTANLAQAGRRMKMPVVDHIVVGARGSFVSMARLGAFEPDRDAGEAFLGRIEDVEPRSELTAELDERGHDGVAVEIS